jgi:hypothetical protein
MTTTPAAPGHADEGTAGYVSPYPYLEKLQQKMEERLDRKVPVKGRFCGFCYGRIRDDTAVCPYCGTATGDRPPVDEVPQEVLRAYLARRRIEERWVHLGAFTGLILAAILFLALVLWAPGWLGHPALAFTVLLLGGYVLAQFFGPFLFAQVGYRKGSRARDEAWARWLARRDGNNAGPAAPGPE